MILNLDECDEGADPVFLRMYKSHKATIDLKNNVVAVLYFFSDNAVRAKE